LSVSDGSRSGEHPGDLVCTCQRRGRDFKPWHPRTELWCSACVEQRWAFDEEWTRTRAFKRATMPRSKHAPGLRADLAP
jgi:hypothetical protein